MNTIWKYDDHLPGIPETARLSLGEGNTPLVRSRSVGKALGISNLWFKLENLNPTGSYKDRFAAVLVSEMVFRQQKVCVATSSGNTGAALAAYCAAAGIRCLIVMVDGAPLPKLRQMQLYGAEILMVRGFGKDAAVTQGMFDRLETFCNGRRIPLPVSAYRYCPSAMQGVETIACELLDEAPADHIFVPAGGGGLTLAVARGVRNKGKAASVHCVQPQGNDTIATPLRNGSNEARSVGSSTTAISGLQVAGVIDGNEVIRQCRALGGNGYVVTDEAVFKWQKQLAQQEGLFCEPAGAVALAGLENAVLRKEIAPDETIVCLVTGSGFKDMQAVERNFGLPETHPYEIEEALHVIESIIL